MKSRLKPNSTAPKVPRAVVAAIIKRMRIWYFTASMGFAPATSCSTNGFSYAEVADLKLARAAPGFVGTGKGVAAG